jgi:hypothetical protein
MCVCVCVCERERERERERDGGWGISMANWTMCLVIAFLNIELCWQIERNVEYVGRKRDGVTFSPKDISAVSSFLEV